MQTEQIKLQFVWVDTEHPSFADARFVRHKVFVEEQGYSAEGEFDSTDISSYHIIGYEKGVPVCTARMFEDGPLQLHIGRVAVLSNRRGKGYGLLMMGELIDNAQRMQAKSLILNAQSDKTYFYECSGFTSTGKTFLDEGQPHTEMLLLL